MKEPFTRLTMEVYYPIKRELIKYSAEVNQWDLSPERAYELVDQLLRAAGYYLKEEE